MPVIGLPVTSSIPRRDAIRRFMRDYPGDVPNTGVINILLDSVEFSDDDVDAAIGLALAWYNATTPITNLPQDGVPEVVLLYGAAAHLLTSEGMRQLRNQATTQDGNVQPIGIDDKQALYQQWAGWMREEFKTAVRQIKTERNMRAAWGGLSSGYLSTTRSRYA